MSVKILYQDVAAGAEEDAQVTTPDAAPFSDPARLPRGTAHGPIAALAPGSWLLDGSREILDGQPAAFWSKQLSGPDGLFAQPPQLEIRFDRRYTSPGLCLTFDPASGEYCSSVTIQWFQGPTLLYEADFRPDGPEFFCGHTAQAYDRVVIRLNAASLPFRPAKLSGIMFGVERVFQREELRCVHVTQEVSIISDQVAVNTLDFTLDSRADVEYMFQFKQPVYAYDGDSLIGVFYISSSKRRGRGLFDVSCEDAVGVLDEDPYPARMLSGYPARALLEDILGGHFPLELDAALSGAALTGYLPEGTRRQALQQAAFALGAMADTSGSGAVRVYKDRESSPRRVPASRTYTGGTVDRSAIVTAVRVLAHSYSTAGTGGDTVEVDGVTYYHTAAAETIANPNATASDKQNVIEVKDATLVNPANAAAVAQHLYDYYVLRDRQRVRIVLDGERPGDHVACATPWGTVMNGYISSMSMTLSGIAAADCVVVGTDVRSVGENEARFSGQIMSGEV